MSFKVVLFFSFGAFSITLGSDISPSNGCFLASLRVLGLSLVVVNRLSHMTLRELSSLASYSTYGSILITEILIKLVAILNSAEIFII